MNATSPDRLSLLRGKYANLVRAKKAEIEALEQKMALIDELEAESSALKDDSVLSPGHYSEMRLTDAAYDAVKEIGGQVTIGQVQKYLLDGGFVPQGKHFAISLAKTLQRLHERDKLETDLKNGKRRYWKKPGENIRLLSEKLLSMK
jgi:hypothetical protein